MSLGAAVMQPQTGAS